MGGVQQGVGERLWPIPWADAGGGSDDDDDEEEEDAGWWRVAVAEERVVLLRDMTLMGRSEAMSIRGSRL